MIEKWQKLDNFSRYLFSDMGRIKALMWKGSNIEKIMTPALSGGYYKTMLVRDDGKYVTRNIHKWIAECFLGPCPDGYEVNHINGIKTDNRIVNLEYTTRSGNIIHAYKLNLLSRKVGEKNGMAKLTNEQVAEIREYVANCGKRYYGRKELAKKYGVSECTIKEVVMHRKNRFYNV
jgi:hypothetical protein